MKETMTFDEIAEAERWLLKNKGKWEDWTEFRWLVPESEVPEFVREFIEWEERGARDLEDAEEILHSMGAWPPSD